MRQILYEPFPLTKQLNKFSFTVPENTHPYIELGKVTLMDDLPRNTLLRIQNFEYSNIFGISRDGSVYLKRSVDAEFKSEFEFLVSPIF